MISVRGLTATYRLGRETIAALDGVDLSIEEKHVFVLLGSSGYGKKTLLRCLAGLATPVEGSITIDGTELSDADSDKFMQPEDRPLVMVFQSCAMWPHIRVFDNVAFPLKAGRQRLPSIDIPKRVDEVLGLFSTCLNYFQNIAFNGRPLGALIIPYSLKHMIQLTPGPNISRFLCGALR